MTESILLTTKGAADLLDISRSAVYRLMAEGALRSVKINGSRRFLRSDIEEFVASLVNPDKSAGSVA